MPNCLAGCISRYACQPINTPSAVGLDWDSASPYVQVEFVNSGNSITVGNESAPCCGNKMVIKSFDYGFSDGFKMDVEIHDEEGGAFQDFIDNMIKCGKNFSNESTTMKAEWGWIITTCEGVKTLFKTPRKLPAAVIDLDVSFSDGKARYKIAGKAIAATIAEFREDKIMGADDQPMFLTDAITQLCAIPPAIQVEFVRINESGQKEQLRWKPPFDPIKGPKCVWSGDSENRLSTISKWVEPFLTENDKGICILCDNSVHNKISVMEDVTIDPGESKPCGNNSLGTFIVNAGGCSNVIEFNPSFNWFIGLSGFNSGGAAGSAADGGREQQEDEKKSPEEEHGENAGMNSFISISRYAFDCHGPKNAVKETNKAQNPHIKANRPTEQDSNKPIKGELRIIGDPRRQFIDIAENFGKPLTIVMINPFHIDGSGNGGCGDWLARPGCNNVLSNKSWMAVGCNHSIKEGFYETVLKVELHAPAVEAGHGEPLGGPGSLGYTPAHTC